MPATSYFGLAGCALLCLALVASALRLDRRPVRVRNVVAPLVVIVLLVPIAHLPVLAYARGVTGDLSATTLALAAGALYFRLAGRTAFAPRDTSALLWAVAAAGLFLYPFALGWTPFDPYELGYGSIAFLTALLVATLAAWRAGLKLVVLVVLAGGLAYLAGVYESRNLWDYLIDPLGAIYALVRLAAGLVRRGAKLAA
jgi:hypothetical protein